MKKALATMSAALLLLLCAAGCGGEGGTASSPRATAAADTTAPEVSGTAATDEVTTGTSDATATKNQTTGQKTGNGKNTTATKKTNTPKNTTKSVAKKTESIKTLPNGGWQSEVKNYTPEELDAPYAARKNIKGTVKAYTPFTGEVFDKAEAMFKKAYPGTKVEWIVTNNVSRHEKLQMLVKAGDSPDYVYSTYQDYPLRAMRGLTMPIDEYIQDHPGQSAMLMNNYSSYKGKRYAVIQETPPGVLFYNTAMFQRAGEKTPTQYYKEGNWTWDTFRAVAKKMTDKQNEIYGFATNGDEMFPLSVGEDIIKFVNGQPKLNLVNNKKYIDAHQFMVDMIVKDKSMYPVRWVANEQFTSGKCAMVLPNGDFRTICKNAGMKTYAIAPFPRRDKNSPYVSGVGGLNGGFSIAQGSKNIEGGMALGEMLINAQLELTGNMTYGREEYMLAKECNMQYVTSWMYGYNLDGVYADFCNWARTGTKDLNTLINENASVFENKLKEMVG